MSQQAANLRREKTQELRNRDRRATPVPGSSSTEAAVARVGQLKALRLNIRLMDLRIAAIALENGAVVVTRNLRDFGRVHLLTIEDWSV
jgi:tRNA(fMet)-specific endonuclease VapC